MGGRLNPTIRTIINTIEQTKPGRHSLVINGVHIQVFRDGEVIWQDYTSREKSLVAVLRNAVNDLENGILKGDN